MSEEEIKKLVELLDKCDPGQLPPDVFVAIARLTVLSAIEFVPLRSGASGTEVLLIPRPDDDPVWPGMLHTPGTILRPTDVNFNDAFRRLFGEELQMNYDETKLVYFGFQFGAGQRGSGITFEHILKIQDSTMGEFYNVDDLPNNFIPEQRAILGRAVAKFESLNPEAN